MSDIIPNILNPNWTEQVWGDADKDIQDFEQSQKEAFIPIAPLTTMPIFLTLYDQASEQYVVCYYPHAEVMTEVERTDWGGEHTSTTIHGRWTVQSFEDSVHGIVARVAETVVKDAERRVAKEREYADQQFERGYMEAMHALDAGYKQRFAPQEAAPTPDDDLGGW